MVTGVIPSPPRYVSSFLSCIGFSIPTARRFSSYVIMFLTHALLALSADHFLCKQKSLRVCALGENWTREIDFSRHEDNLPSHRGRRLVFDQILGIVECDEWYAPLAVFTVSSRRNPARCSRPKSTVYCTAAHSIGKRPQAVVMVVVVVVVGPRTRSTTTRGGGKYFVVALSPPPATCVYVCMCVLRSFYPSTSGTPRVRADSWW